MLPEWLKFVITGGFATALMIGLWVRQRATKNAGIVDVGWSFAIGVIGVFFAAMGSGYTTRRLIAGTLIAGWSIRLTAYLFHRVHEGAEDGRYASLRRDWGNSFDRRLFWFFQMQAAAALLFATPLWFDSQNRRSPLGLADFAAIVVWIVGVGGVALADAQLAAFKKSPDSKGKTCRAGLWRYSRHPNYFFEWIHWWTYVLLAIGAPYGLLTMIVPALLLYVLLFVTGIPVTEAQALSSRGDDYRDYQRTTSAFIPWFPKPSK